MFIVWSFVRLFVYVCNYIRRINKNKIVNGKFNILLYIGIFKTLTYTHKICIKPYKKVKNFK